jgi:hypothetical protein
MCPAFSRQPRGKAPFVHLQMNDATMKKTLPLLAAGAFFTSLTFAQQSKVTSPLMVPLKLPI